MKKIFKVLGLIFLMAVALLASILVGKTVSQRFAKASNVCQATNIKALKPGTNNAVITWETKEDTQGSVRYGTDPQNLGVSAEAASGTSHNVPLTLLTPNTVYYYLISIGRSICDSSGQGCDGDHLEKCTPFSFTTNPLVPQDQAVAPITTDAPLPPASPTSFMRPGNIVPTITNILLPPVSTGETLSPFCQKVKDHQGASASLIDWEQVKLYDIDNNGVINGVDIIKCKTSGK